MRSKPDSAPKHLKFQATSQTNLSMLGSGMCGLKSLARTEHSPGHFACLECAAALLESLCWAFRTSATAGASQAGFMLRNRLKLHAIPTTYHSFSKVSECRTQPWHLAWTRPRLTTPSAGLPGTSASEVIFCKAGVLRPGLLGNFSAQTELFEMYWKQMV